ncbi:MAG: aminopeptidase P family N-terminal domain-containing protein, partial [Acidimicrobiales bacterium]
MSLGPAPGGPVPVAARLERLRPLVEQAGADALLVTELPNVRYLTGFTGSAAVVLVTADTVVLTTDGRYRTQAAEQLTASGAAPVVELVVGGVAAQRDAVVAALQRGGAGRHGLEANPITGGAQ